MLVSIRVRCSVVDVCICVLLIERQTTMMAHDHRNWLAVPLVLICAPLLVIPQVQTQQFPSLKVNPSDTPLYVLPAYYQPRFEYAAQPYPTFAAINGKQFSLPPYSNVLPPGPQLLVYQSGVGGGAAGGGQPFLIHPQSGSIPAQLPNNYLPGDIYASGQPPQVLVPAANYPQAKPANVSPPPIEKDAEEVATKNAGKGEKNPEKFVQSAAPPALRYFILNNQPLYSSFDPSTPLVLQQNRAATDEEGGVVLANAQQPYQYSFFNNYGQQLDVDNDAIIIDSKDSSGIPTPVKAIESSQKSSEPTISQAQPGAIALAGNGGVAAASPRGTSLVGKGGVAYASPHGTAVAGPTQTRSATQATPTRRRTVTPQHSSPSSSSPSKFTEHVASSTPTALRRTIRADE